MYALELNFKVDLYFTSDPDLTHDMVLIPINDIIFLNCLKNEHFKYQNLHYNELR